MILLQCQELVDSMQQGDRVCRQAQTCRDDLRHFGSTGGALGSVIYALGVARLLFQMAPYLEWSV
jgi:hypothetical protein